MDTQSDVSYDAVASRESSPDSRGVLPCATFRSPVGALTLVADAHGLRAVLWENDTPERVRLPALIATTGHPLLDECARQLSEYFAGDRRRFELPLSPRGTDFQRRVWLALRDIPFGERRSYREIAVDIGAPQAMRAVGAANGRNPLSIVVPCHRVVGADGSLTGFAGGLEAKQRLLAQEQRFAAEG